jgi:hypothetical protein
MVKIAATTMPPTVHIAQTIWLSMAAPSLRYHVKRGLPVARPDRKYTDSNK